MKVTSPNGAVVPTAAAIQTAGLTKRFGRSRGIDEVTLTVPHGEVFGFLGPNGAGKTTTIRMLMGVLRPSGGRALMLGHDASPSNGASARPEHASIGYLRIGSAHLHG